MVQYRIINYLNRFFPNPNNTIVNLVLRLIMNLSFDYEFCDQVSKDSILQKIVELLKVNQFRAIGISILYQLSKSEYVRIALTMSECIPIIYKLLIHFPEPIIAPELVALTINLTNLKKNCEVFALDGKFEKLFTRALKNNDINLIKAIKNIVTYIRHKDVQSVVSKNLIEITKLAFNHTTPIDYKLELMGILAYTESRDWETVNKETNLVQYLQQ